ncbi:hypothetical protein L4D20_18065 [Vibrio kyushuensis]|uniref:hypothetical protein n=1 Tax=Vibrio kyushuensis TaxID=2910249 RepID=UPI003D0AA447
MMKKTLLAITMATLISAPAISAPVKVDRALANQYTAELIEAQMNEIDARVLAQLNAQPSTTTTATVDDVVYEKQSDGTWAAVGAVSATLLASLLSSSSSTGGHADELPDMPIDAPRQLPDVDVSTPDNTKPDFDFITDGNGKIGIVRDGVLLGTIEGSINVNTRHLEVGPMGGIWYNNPQAPAPIKLPFKVESSITGPLVITDTRTGEIVGIGGQIGGDTAPIKLTIVKSDLGWTIFGSQGRSVTITDAELKRPDLPIDAPRQLPDVDVSTPDNTNPDFDFITDGNGKIGIVRDGVLLGTIEGSINVNTRHLEVGPMGGIWYKNPQAPVPIKLPFKVESSITGHLVITDTRTSEIVGIGGQIGGDMAPVKLTIVKSDLGWTIFGSQGRSVTITDAELKRSDTVINGNQGGVVIVDHANRDVIANDEAKDTIKTLAKQPRFDDVRNKVRAKFAQ